MRFHEASVGGFSRRVGGIGEFNILCSHLIGIREAISIFLTSKTTPPETSKKSHLSLTTIEAISGCHLFDKATEYGPVKKRGLGLGYGWCSAWHISGLDICNWQ